MKTIRRTSALSSRRPITIRSKIQRKLNQERLKDQTDAVFAQILLQDGIAASCRLYFAFLFGTVALPCELMTHFRLQFTLVLIVMTGALFALKLRNYGIISLVALVMNAVPIILLYAPQNASANPEASAG